MGKPQPYRIGVVASESPDSVREVLDLLQAGFPVEHSFRQMGHYQGLDALILAGASECHRADALRIGVPVLVFLSASKRTALGPSLVTFTNCEATPALLRGQRFARCECDSTGAVGPGSEDQVVATVGNQPVWVARRSPVGVCHRVAMPFPELGQTASLCDLLNECAFFRILPLIQFLREVTAEESWSVPLRASLMFDDPNLHWPHYGFIDFSKLAASGKRHNYHTSIATVPLDGWYTHPAAARLFRENADQISLLVHGNNHTYAELLAHSEEAECGAYVTQALQRITRLERKSGVMVSRVMAAPHGACSEEMLRAMACAGYEAATISATSLRYYNSERPWVRALGFAVTENIQGLPVMPRFRISADCKARILIAAYLRQPIIPVGHHYDVADGLELLESVAGFINSLGPVQWMDMAKMTRSNFLSRYVDDTLEVRLFSNCVELSVPVGVSQLRVANTHGFGAAGVCFRVVSGKRVFESSLGKGTGAIQVAQGDRVTITVPPHPPVNLESIRSPRLGLWPVARRVLVECRDRLQPLRRMVSSRKLPK